MGPYGDHSGVVGSGLMAVHAGQAQRPQHGDSEATEPLLGVLPEAQCRGLQAKQSIISFVLTPENKVFEISFTWHKTHGPCGSSCLLETASCVTLRHRVAHTKGLSRLHPPALHCTTPARTFNSASSTLG